MTNGESPGSPSLNIQLPVAQCRWYNVVKKSIAGALRIWRCKMRKRLLAIILGIAVVMAFSPVMVFAGDSDYIELFTPEEENSIWYMGEYFYGEYRAYDTWLDYSTLPTAVITDSNGEVVDTIVSDTAVENRSHTDYYLKFDIDRKYHPGQYTVYVFAMPMLDDEDADISEFDVPEKHYNITIRRLGTPASVRLAAGRGKVTVSWAEVSDAQKYQVYRSTKKSSGYSKVATTANRAFVDKKVKKGKRYYYKVRAVRAGNGTIYGAFTAPKKSGKVR